MGKFLKAFGFKEPEPRPPRLGINLRGNDYATITGDVEEIVVLCERLDSREESYIRTYPKYTDECNYWIPDVVSYWIDWGDFEPGVKND